MSVAKMAANGRVRGVAGLLIDIVLPIAAYYAARGAGLPERAALLTAAGTALVRVVWTAVRTREVTWPAVLVLTGYALGLGLGFLTGDARFILAKDSASTAAISVVILVSAAVGRPFTLSLSKSLNPAKAAGLQRRFDAEPGVRRHFQRGALVWGFGFLADAIGRLPLIYLAPIDVTAGTSQALVLVVVCVLGAWSVHRAVRWHAARPAAR